MTESASPMHGEAQGATAKTKARIGRPPKPYCRLGHAMKEENVYRSGKQRKCRICRNDRLRRAKEVRAAGGQYRKKVSDDPLYYRERQLKRLYGITLEQYRNMYRRQDGKCAICAEARKLHVDHDHDTGRPRGLLCHRCNIWLAVVEAEGFFMAAVDYLMAHSDG